MYKRTVNRKFLFPVVISDMLASMEMANPATPDPRTLLGQFKAQIRLRHYSLRTEEAYVYWARRYLRFHHHRHPREMGAEEVKAFLSALAGPMEVAASTQNQALSALLFLYKEVLGVDLPWLDGIRKAKRPRRLPVVLTRDEARALLARMDGTHGLMARLLYGTGMRLMECLRLRVKDIELVRREIVIREGKGGRGRGAARRLRAEEPRSGNPVGLALGVSAGFAFDRSALGHPAPPPRLRPDLLAFPVARRPAGRRRETRHRARAAPQLRHPPHGGGLRHPHGAGAARPQGREHDDDLHARPQPGRAGRGEPAGPLNDDAPMPPKVADILRLLRDDGWYLVATRGSHRQFQHHHKPGRVTVHGKPGDNISPGTLNSILKQSGLGK